jgi:hypothetical protein
MFKPTFKLVWSAWAVMVIANISQYLLTGHIIIWGIATLTWFVACSVVIVTLYRIIRNSR